MSWPLQVRSGPAREYADVLTGAALDALGALAPLDADQGPARFAEERAETARECLGSAHGRDSDQATTERTPVTLRTRPFRRQPM